MKRNMIYEELLNIGPTQNIVANSEHRCQLRTSLQNHQSLYKVHIT
jgi:hypothetical protein